MQDRYRHRLQKYEQSGLLRRRVCLSSPNDTQIRVGSRVLCNFSSNNYLDLANHPMLRQSFSDAARVYGMGAGASQFISGYTQPLRALEDELAEFTGRDKVVLCTSGYLANQAVVTALADRSSYIVADKLSHASLIDAARLSGAVFRRYPHCDIHALERRLAGCQAGARLVLTDSIFSMEGDLAPLPALAKVSRAYDGLLIVDDAHGIGVLGMKTGAGSLAHFALGQDEVPLLVATFSKAFGVSGAFIAGPHRLVDTILQKGRSTMYTTALMPALAAAIQTALGMVKKETYRREKLFELVDFFRQEAVRLGLDILPACSPIQGIVLGSNQAVLATSQHLYEAGFFVPAIRSPTVPVGTERLRISITAGHSQADLRSLLACLERHLM